MLWPSLEPSRPDGPTKWSQHNFMEKYEKLSLLTLFIWSTAYMNLIYINMTEWDCCEINFLFPFSKNG